MLCCSESGPTLLQATRKNKMVSLKEITCITSVIFWHLSGKLKMHSECYIFALIAKISCFGNQIFQINY